MTALAGVGRPSPERKYGNDGPVVDGIELGLQALCEPTEKQVGFYPEFTRGFYAPHPPLFQKN